MATVQGGPGKVRMFEDFLGAEVPIALTTDVENLGQFLIGGEGIEQGTSYGGAVVCDTDGLSGVIKLTTDDEDLDTIAIKSAICWDVALMGPLVMEVRSRFVDLDAKAAFIGFSDVADDDVDLATDVIDYSAGTTVSLTASDLCGFYFSSEFTDDNDWHGVYNGGTTTGETTTTSIDLDDDAVAGEFQIFRVEIDPNGTARWYIDGVLKQTVETAVSTTTDFLALVAITANSAEQAVMDVDYILVEGNRDWTV